MPESVVEALPAEVYIVDSELFRIEAVVRWLDATDARLKRLPAVSSAQAPHRAVRRTMGVRR